MPYIGVHLNSLLQIQYLPDDDSDPPLPPHHLQRSCHRRGAEGDHLGDDQGVEQEGCPGGGDPCRRPVEHPPCQVNVNTEADKEVDQFPGHPVIHFLANGRFFFLSSS